MKQGWFYRFERKFGRYRIPGLMRYIVMIQVAGTLLGLLQPGLYANYLMLDFGKILQGQIWRLFTFLLVPKISLGVNANGMGNIFMFALELYIYYSIGNTLERVWGSFRFTCYYISGILMSIIAGFLLFVLSAPLGFAIPWTVGFEYINLSMMLAFVVVFPNVEFLLMFIIPVKAKWLGIFYGVILVLDIMSCLSMGFVGYGIAVAIIVSMLNFVIFFFATKNPYQKAKTVKRRQQFVKQTGPKVVSINRHRCAICGRTERDNENLEFRFCSKCDGNYEYCSDHIYTHEHVKKD